MSSDSFLQAIKDGNIDLLRAMLEDHPELLEASLKISVSQQESYTGFALNMAACLNQPAVIEFLVEEKKVDINRQQGHKSSWTALHHACDTKSYEAAEMLLELGANPSLRNDSDSTPLDRCGTDQLKRLVSGAINGSLAHAKREKKETRWTLTSPVEVMSARRLPDNSYRLTEIFNFESRRVTAITKDIRSGHLAQNILFFDDIADKQILHAAHAQLTQLGGTAEASVIDRPRLGGKSKLTGPQ